MNSLQYLDNIYSVGSEEYVLNNNFYLYLMSMFIQLPEKYQNMASLFNFQNIRSQFSDDLKSPQYKIRLSCMNKKFGLAMRQINEWFHAGNKITIQYFILKALLKQNLEVYTNDQAIINDLIKNKQFKELGQYLFELDEFRGLNFLGQMLLSLNNDLLDMLDSGVIYEKEIVDTDNLKDAIMGKNYELALSLVKEYNEQKCKISQYSSIYLMLDFINDWIVEQKELIEKTNVSLGEDGLEVDTCEKEDEVLQVDNSNCDKRVSSLDIIHFLEVQDLDQAVIKLKEYLKEHEKCEYEFLFLDLMKLCIIRQEMDFSSLKMFFSSFDEGVFEFQVTRYVQSFYGALAENRFDEARVYLDIVSKASKLGQVNNHVDKMTLVLSNVLKVMQDQLEESNVIENSCCEEVLEEHIDSSYGGVVDDVRTDDSFLEEEVLVEHALEKVSESSKERSLDNSKVLDVKAKNDSNELRQFIDKKLLEVQEWGMVLLKPMDNQRIKALEEQIKDIPNIDTFCIGEGKLQQVVLRLKSTSCEEIDFSSIANEGVHDYKKGDYASCILKYRQLLEHDEKNMVWVYGELGLAYGRQYKKDIAIDYLTVATELAKKENKDVDFTYVISCLRGEVSIKERKAHKVRMKEADFFSDNNNYGIECFDEVIQDVSMGQDVLLVCANKGLNVEQQMITLLLLARECYIFEDYRNGDLYLKQVEQMKNKSKLVCSLMNEIRRSKRFYKNRREDKSKRLTLAFKK